MLFVQGAEPRAAANGLQRLGYVKQAVYLGWNELRAPSGQTTIAGVQRRFSRMLRHLRPAPMGSKRVIAMYTLLMATGYGLLTLACRKPDVVQAGVLATDAGGQDVDPDVFGLELPRRALDAQLCGLGHNVNWPEPILALFGQLPHRTVSDVSELHFIVERLSHNLP